MDTDDIKKTNEELKEEKERKAGAIKKRFQAGTRFIHKTAHMIKEATEQFRLDAEYENPERPEDVRYDDIITPLSNSEYEEENPVKQDVPKGEVEITEVKAAEETSENTGSVSDNTKARAATEVKDKLIIWRILANLALTIITVVLIVYLVPKVFKFLLPFVIAAILAAIATPLVKLIRKKLKVTQKLGSAIVIVLVIAAVVGVLYGAIYFLLAQLNKLIAEKDQIIASIKAAVASLGENMKPIYSILPANIQKFVSGTSEDFTQGLSDFLTEAFTAPTLSDASSFVNAGVDVVFGVIVCFIAAYMFTSQQAEIVNWLRDHTPKSTLEYFRLIRDNFKKAIGGYFKAQFKIMLIMFGIMFIWFEIMDIDYSALVAFGVAFLDFLPVFGMGAVLWPWIVVDIVGAKYTEAILLGILYGLCQLIRQILQPKLVSDAVEMNPFLTLLFMFVGYRIKGVWGLILGIPSGMVLVSLYRIGAFDRLTKGVKIIVKLVNDFRKY